MWLTWLAVINVSLTLLARVTRLAFALVATHGVEAKRSVAARALHTFVDINLTCLTLCSDKDKRQLREDYFF